MSQLSPARLAAGVIAQLRVHRSWQAELAGQTVWFKRRRLGMSLVIALGNVFFRRAGAQLSMLSRIEDWLDHELTHWRACYGQDSCGKYDSRTLWTRALPGSPLSHSIRDRRHGVAAFRAAGCAVAMFHARSQAGGSHGDLHVDNLLYDKAGDRAYVIDFDTVSQCQGTELRQGEDLAIFLLDLYRRVPDGVRRRELCDAFLAADHAATVRAACQTRLSEILAAGSFLARIMRVLRIGAADPSAVEHELSERLVRR